MKEIISIYHKHQLIVENHIETFIRNQPDNPVEQPNNIFTNNSFVQLLYGVNQEFKQITPLISSQGQDKSRIGSDKSHYFNNITLNSNGIYISNPYLHHRTGKITISILKYSNKTYYVYDIDLVQLLENLGLIQYSSIYNSISRVIYGFGAILLSLISLFLITYGGYKLFLVLGNDEVGFFSKVFKSIISITLGLAIYDLAKQILEHEVIFHSFHHDDKKQYNVLGKFLISVIVALSIESMMVVFKIALSDYTHMLSAFYLLVGTTLFLFALTYFYKIIVNK